MGHYDGALRWGTAMGHYDGALRWPGHVVTPLIHDANLIELIVNQDTMDVSYREFNLDIKYSILVYY